MKERWISDLSKCEPRNAIGRDGSPGEWIAVDYQAEPCPHFDGSGVMIFGVPGSDAPPLRIPIDVDGWHEIRIGIFYGMGAGTVEDRVLLARLTGDAAYTRFYRESYVERKDGHYPWKSLRWFDLAEVFWKSADLTEQDIIIARPPKGEECGMETNLAYVRLVPMKQGAVEGVSAERPTPETHRLIANFDGGNIRRRGSCTREDFLSEFQAIRDSDFDIVLHAMARGTITLYPSRVGEFVRPQGFHRGGRILRECVRRGRDPLAEVIEAAHECGLKLFPQNRLVGVGIPTRHQLEDFGGKLMKDHPEWRCTYHDDEPLRHLSLAFQGVRDFHVRLMREWVEDYGADGVNVIFSRSFPFVYYEEPVRARFEEIYGEDMSGVPPEDVRSQKTRATFVTEFLREIRSMLDDVGREQGRQISSCYLVPIQNSPANLPEDASRTGLGECLFNALDVREWIGRDLVDYLVLHIHMYEEHDGTYMQPRIREFTQLARNTSTRVFADMYPRRMPPRKYREIAISYYDAGADGLAFWDFQNRHPRASEIAFVKRLGHVKDLPEWKTKGRDYFRVIPLRRLDGFLTSREFARPHDG